jgi:hypothetical protein
MSKFWRRNRLFKNIPVATAQLDDQIHELKQKHEPPNNDWYTHLPTKVVAVKLTETNIQNVVDWINDNDGVAELLNLGPTSSPSLVVAISTGESKLFALLGDYIIQLKSTTGDFNKMTDLEFTSNYTSE